MKDINWINYQIWWLLASHLFEVCFWRSGDEFNHSSNSSSIVILFEALSHVIQPTYNILVTINIHVCHKPYAQFWYAWQFWREHGQDDHHRGRCSSGWSQRGHFGSPNCFFVPVASYAEIRVLVPRLPCITGKRYKTGFFHLKNKLEVSEIRRRTLCCLLLTGRANYWDFA